MPWRPLPRIAFAIATHPFQPSESSDLPLELGDELYIIEEGGKDWSWFRGYLVAPPSLLAGLTSIKGQTLEARVFSGIFPRSCVEVRELLGPSHQGMQPNREFHRQIGLEKAGIAPSNTETWIETIKGSSQELQSRFAGGQKSLTFQSGSNEQPVTQSNGYPTLSQDHRTATVRHSETPRPAAPVPMLKIGDETPTSASEPLVDEIASCLREWHSTNLHELLLSRNYGTIDRLSRLVNLLDTSRRQLLHGVLTNAELVTLREKTVWDLVSGNKMLGNEIVVRDPLQRGRLLTGDDSPVEIAKLQSTMSLLDKPATPHQDDVNLHHLLIELRDFSANETPEDLCLIAYLGTKRDTEPLKPLTEAFEIEIPARENISPWLSSGKLRTLFPNLSAMDAGVIKGSGTSLYLAIKVLVSLDVQSMVTEPTRGATARDSAIARKDGSTQHASVGSRSGRRSLMFGSYKPQRQHSQSSGKLDNIAEQSVSFQSPPRSSSSSRPQTRSKDTYRIRKVVGAAILPLQDFLSVTQNVERDVTVWSTENSSQVGESPELWDSAINSLFPFATDTLTRLRRLSNVKLRLSSFVSADADTLVRATPTLLHNVPQAPKMGFSSAPTKPRSDIYITLKEPRLPDGALFSHPERGFLQLNSSLAMENLQLTLEVRKSDGQRVDKCIFPTSESTGHTAWRSMSVARGGSWGQTFRLAIPVEDVPTAHVIMSIADAPGFPFALCWMPLWCNGAFLQDGLHLPLLHLYDKATSSTQNGRGAYLDLPWDAKAKDSLKFESVAGPMAMLSMESYLCSTVLSQDQVVLSILRWREQSDSDLLVLLRQLVFVPEIEIVKHVSDLFDSLFAIIVDRSGSDEFEDLVFAALVTVLGIVHDRRFRLGPLVNEYAEVRFNFPFATPCLTRSYLRIIMKPPDYQNSRQLNAALKVGQQIIKFILVARKQQMIKELSIGVTKTHATFNRNFKQIFSALEFKIRDQSAKAIGSKTILVQHVHTWFPELRLCFSEEESLDITISFIDACEDVQGRLVLHKLVLIWNVIRHSKSTHSSVARALQSRLHEWLDHYWGDTAEVNDQYHDQVRLCCSILSLLDGAYGPAAIDFYLKILKSYACIVKSPRTGRDSTSLLFQSSYPFQTKPASGVASYDEALTELATLKATIPASDIVENTDLLRPDLVDLILLGLEIDMSIISNTAFPSSWLTLNVFQHRVIFDMLNSLSALLLQNFLPPPEEAERFNTELWKQFLLSVLKLVRSDVLALETFPEQKRRAVWKVGGDIREKGAELLANVWNKLGWDTDLEERERFGLDRLGGYQVQYVPSLVKPIVELCLSIHGGLRRVAVELLQSMIISEWSLNEDLAIIQAEMVICLDSVFKSKGVGDNTQQKLFIQELTEAFGHLEHTADRELWEATEDLVSILDDLLNLLVAAHAPEQDETHRIMHTLQLMDFLKGIQKQDMYLSYVHQLATVEAQARNFKQAGLALRLHADLYDWNPIKPVPESFNPPFPNQSSFERKESLYFQMIEYFEEAHAWEPALDAYHELAQHYETTSFDFAKLARTQRATARIYEMIARGETDTPRYFRVIYSGLGFPENLRDKAFIFEGSASERLSNFTDRLLQQHPSAQLISHGEADGIEGQFLQVTAMTPHRELANPLFQRQKVSHSTKGFLSSLRNQRFSVTTRRHSPKSGVKDQWVEKTIYTTADVFPTIIRRSEIITEETVSLSPLETALERTLRKCYELAILDRRVTNGDDSSTFSLMEAIRTSVDPSSGTSVAHYRKILPLIPRMATEGEKQQLMQPLEMALQTSLIDFASTLKHSLGLLERFGNDLEYQTLSMQFASTFAHELSIISSVQHVSTLRQASLTLPQNRITPQLFTNGTTSVGANRELSNQPDSFEYPSRNRNTPMLGRGSQAITVLLSPSQPGDNVVEPRTNSNAIEDTRSASTSHGSVHESSKNSHSLRPSEDTQEPASAMANRPINVESRPATAHSATTHKSIRSGRKSDSIRKRLSTLGIARKPSNGALLGERVGVREE